MEIDGLVDKKLIEDQNELQVVF